MQAWFFYLSVYSTPNALKTASSGDEYKIKLNLLIPFEDYSVKELCDIAKLIAAEKKLTLSPNAESKLATVFEAACKNTDFGNGRFARNILEKAKMAQANRLMKMDFDMITDKDLTTLIADDIEMPKGKIEEKVIKIDFCAWI